MWQIWVRRGLLGISLCFASILAYILFTHSDSGSSATRPRPDVLHKADAGMADFTFTQTREGSVQWEVVADHAEVFESRHEAVLQGVVVTLHGSTGKQITLQGEEGVIDTRTKDFVVANTSDPIRIDLEGGYHVFTNALEWKDSEGKFYTEAPITLVGNGMNIEGRGFRGTPASEEFKVLHDVQVSILP